MHYKLFALLATILLLDGSGIAQSNHLIEIGVPDSLYSNTLHESRDFWVILPEGFDEGSKESYPVVYILDGSQHLKALETVYTYYSGHHLPDMILVGISNQTNRTRDLTTSKVSYRNGGAVNESTGGAEDFTRFLKSELIPYVDAHYPTTPYRTLIGHSYGGLFAINTLVNHPQLFENYMAIDPSLDWDNQKLMKVAKEKLRNEDYSGKSLYISLAAGQLHMLNGEITMENVMQDSSEYTLMPRSIIDLSTFAEAQTQNGLSFSWGVFPEDYHWTLPLPSIRKGLITQFEWYQLKSAEKYSNPETSLDELMELVKERETTLNKHFGYPTPPLVEELLNMTGYMYLQFAQPEKSYVFFKMCIDYYPESANAYDSMADYYESQNDIDKAVISLSRAYELSGNEYYKLRIEELKGKE
jgi:predicted alpha/beta superfamily hydrolase